MTKTINFKYENSVLSRTDTTGLRQYMKNLKIKFDIKQEYEEAYVIFLYNDEKTEFLLKNNNS